ncbi:unnamed protein product [Chironomus riparius]|uniref:Uncharacterized protein n=1 Tax=Chironomus riparius TaxID=315576 RepID=A0A9N9WUZ3_9DIPT|nr:unnamed protein product [Chironomus riparius]
MAMENFLSLRLSSFHAFSSAELYLKAVVPLSLYDISVNNERPPSAFDACF